MRHMANEDEIEELAHSTITSDGRAAFSGFGGNVETHLSIFESDHFRREAGFLSCVHLIAGVAQSL